MRNLILVAFLALVATGCKKENPYIDPVPAEPPMQVNNVAFIWNNDVYYMSDMRGSATRITTTGTTKTMVRMSHDHTRFAYRNASNIIEVVDNTGALLYTLPQFTSVDDFNWSADDSTLYILRLNQVQYYGPSMNLPPITFPNVPGTASKWVISASVSAQNDFAYVITYQDFSGFGSLLVIKPHDGSPTLTRELNDPFLEMRYVRFSIHATDMVIGYKGAGGNPNYTRVEMFTGLSTTPVRIWESSEEYFSPVYRSDINALTTAYNSSSSSTLVLASRDLDATIATVDESITLSNYSAGQGALWLDWK